MQYFIPALLTFSFFTTSLSAQIMDVTIGMTDREVQFHAQNDFLGFTLQEQSEYIYKYQATLNSGSEIEVIFEMLNGEVNAIFFSNTVPTNQSIEWDFFRHFKEACYRNPNMVSSSRMNKYYESVFRSEKCSVEAFENTREHIATIIYRYEEGEKFIQGRWIVRTTSE